MSVALKLREREIAQYLRYTRHISPQILSCGDLEYMSAFRLSGRSWDGITLNELRDWNTVLHTALLGQLFGATSFYVHTVRRRVREYPKSECRLPFARRFASRYESQFDERGLMINELYLSILVRPQHDAVLSKLSKVERASAVQLEAWRNELIERLESTVRAFQASFGAYDPELLQIVERNGVAYSEIQEYLALVLNGRHFDMPVTRGTVADDLPVARPIFSRWGSLGELRYPDHPPRIFGMLEVRSLPEKLFPGHLDTLLSAPFEYILTQSFSTLSKAESLKAVEKQRRLLEDSGDHSKSQIHGLTRALDDLAGGRLGGGEHHATMLVLGDDAQSVQSSRSKAIGLFSAASINAKAVGLGLEAAFWSQMPGNWSWRLRPDPITSMNFLDLTGFHNQLSGKATGNPWGPAVCMFKTTTGAPFFFNFHTSLEEVDETGKRRPGNVAVIGKTGTGKTVLMGVLCTLATKFEASLALLDKDRGMQVTVMALGGRYFVLRMGEPTGWAPLQLPPTKRNVAFMQRLIEHLIGVRGESVSTSDAREIARALGTLLQMDLPERRLTNLVALLAPLETRLGVSSVRDRLLPWCEGNEYGWLLDGHEDALDLGDESSHEQIILGFDLTELLDDPIARSAATMVLDHRIDTLTNGRRLVKNIDEAQHPLRDAHFAAKAQDDARTIRKKNGVQVFASQEVAALLAIEAGVTMINQAATKCFLPNPTAKWDEYKQMGVTPAVFELIKSLGEHSRQMVVVQGSSAAVVDINLPGCDDELLVFSGSEDLAIIAEKAVQEVGPDPEVWLPIYLERARAALKSA